MAVNTRNKFGKIFISDQAIAMVANYAASECYGVADLVPPRFTDAIANYFNRIPHTQGVKIETVSNKINVEIFAVLIDGVNKDAVCDSVRENVRYQIENFTGMRVNNVSVHVVGVKE